ncbi:hypothetical protein GUJ93_ZPchr0002g24619 [Zizania palustris]|uniref:7,8-dihydroneopterin aldolase n=1 Tax=Zizania palustris TaxID=103762 RepID=A0A8J5VVC1_ZIZPA|nr:hypothetical protein GUJ93_ZPchr0002g24619 [Zizania palustris]
MSLLSWGLGGGGEEERRPLLLRYSLVVSFLSSFFLSGKGRKYKRGDELPHLCLFVVVSRRLFRREAQEERGILIRSHGLSGAIMAERELINKDKLLLRGLKFHGFHGVKQEEKILGQKFVVDVDAWMDLSASGESDNEPDTVSYTDIYRIVKDVVEGPSLNLLEAVAHRISSATLLKFPQISAIRVKVGKPHVDVQGIVDYLGVEILSCLYVNNFD